MTIAERFIRYAKINTCSDPLSGTTPSSAVQFDLARVLLKELQDMGVEDAVLTDHGSIYAHLPANTDAKVPTVGFIAHMDTAPDYSGAGVQPRVIDCYDGGDIELCPGVVTRIKDFPQMQKLKGDTLIVTDGSTLLGADDKAGIAAIMEAAAWLIAHPEVRHGRIAIAFTPDEEIGEGTKYFDLEQFGADYAYTMDGGDISLLADETFNAATATVDFTGLSIHPGSAKDRMINAGGVAMEYAAMMPAWMRPEHTEGHEGFIHLTGMTGNVDHAVLQYILRDHDADRLAEKKQLMERARDLIEQIYGSGTVRLTITDQYRNMHDILKDHKDISELAMACIQELGLVPEKEIVRGGTDGAELTYRGLPCPNLGTGGGNAHGRYEYVSVQQMKKAVRLICLIAERNAGKGC